MLVVFQIMDRIEYKDHLHKNIIGMGFDISGIDTENLQTNPTGNLVHMCSNEDRKQPA